MSKDISYIFWISNFTIVIYQWGSFTTFLQIDLFRSYNSFSQRVCCYVDVMLKIWNEPIFLGLYLLTWSVILTMGINEKKYIWSSWFVKKALFVLYKFFKFLYEFIWETLMISIKKSLDMSPPGVNLTRHLRNQNIP